MTSPWHRLRRRFRGRGAMRLASRGLVWLGAAVLLFFLLPLWLLPPARNVTLAAETQVAEITFLSETRWTLPGARHCPAGGSCADAPPLDPDWLDFRPCDRVRVRRGWADGTVAILPSPAVLGAADGDPPPRLLMPAAAFRAAGPQVFEGHLDLGALPQSGRSLLLTGDYAFFQRDPLAVLLRLAPDEIDRGSFRGGDRVIPVHRPWPLWRAPGRTEDCEAADVAGQPPQPVFGQLGPAADTATPAFLVTATSTGADVALAVTRRGFERALMVRPSWIDVVIASPAFFAVTVILTFLGTLMQTVLPAPDDPPE